MVHTSSCKVLSQLTRLTLDRELQLEIVTVKRLLSSPCLASSSSVKAARAPRHVPQQSTYLGPAGSHCFRSHRTPAANSAAFPAYGTRPLAAGLHHQTVDSTRQGRCVCVAAGPSPDRPWPLDLLNLLMHTLLLEYYPIPLATCSPSASCLTPIVLCCIPPAALRPFGKAHRNPSHDLLTCGRRHSRRHWHASCCPPPCAS